MRHLPTLMLGALFLLGFTCPFGPTAQKAAEVKPSAFGDQFLVWRLDGKQSSTAWVTEGQGAVHTRAGIWLGANGRLWKWATTAGAARVVDCGCYDPYNLPPREDLRRARREACAREVTVDALSIEEASSEQRIVGLTQSTEDDPDELVGRISRSFAPLGSVGRWLFVARREERMRCTDAQADVKWAFGVIDLDAGQFTELLAPSDRARLDQVERARAAEQLCKPPDCFSSDPSKFRFALMRPTWKAGGDLAMTLQFATNATLSTPDELWDSGTRSVRFDAGEIPLAMRPFVDTPRPVRALWRSEAPETGGWTIAGDDLRTRFGG